MKDRFINRMPGSFQKMEALYVNGNIWEMVIVFVARPGRNCDWFKEQKIPVKPT